MFWAMTRQVDRLTAEDDLRMLDVMLVASAASQNADKELVNKLRDALLDRRGTISKEKQIYDSPEEVRAKLRKMME